jgi:hypothetical protein
MGFNIGDMISGAVVGFLETGNPVAAGAIGVMDGITNRGPGSSLGIDSVLSGGSDTSSLINLAQMADASG